MSDTQPDKMHEIVEKAIETAVEKMKEYNEWRENVQKEWEENPTDTKWDPFSSGGRAEWHEAELKFEDEVKKRLDDLTK